MVDLDQCTHATINGCDKERRGWYPLPSSLSSSICLPSCPPPCPLPNCFFLMITHLHLRWHPPGHRLSWCWGPADGKGAWCAVGCLHPLRSTCSMGELRAPSLRLIMRSRFHLLSHTWNFFLFFFLMPTVAGHTTWMWCFWTSPPFFLNAPLLVLPSADATSRPSFHFLQEIWVWNTSAPNWISFVTFRVGSDGPLRKLRWMKMGQRQKHRGESGAEVWLSESTMDGSGPVCTLVNKFKRHKQRLFSQNYSEIWFWV